MIILTSNGLSSDKLTKELQQYVYVGKAALVVTADNEYKEKNYHVERLSEELRSLGLSVECFDFDNRSPDELLGYDVVELIGGNPYYLLDSIRKHGFCSVLKFFAEEKLIIGCSAGALVLTPSLELIDLYSPEMNFMGLDDLTACNVTDVYVLPHYSKFINKFDGFEEKCSEYERSVGCEVVRINDGEGVIVNKGVVDLIK